MYRNHTIRAYHKGYVALQKKHSRKVRITCESDRKVIYESESAERLTAEQLKALIDNVIDRKE